MAGAPRDLAGFGFVTMGGHKTWRRGESQGRVHTTSGDRAIAHGSSLIRMSALDPLPRTLVHVPARLYRYGPGRRCARTSFVL
jgi:hypothetical protein